MVLGYTYGEVGLAVFIFGLIYGAQLLPKAAALAGRMMGDRRNANSRDP